MEVAITVGVTMGAVITEGGTMGVAITVGVTMGVGVMATARLLRRTTVASAAQVAGR